MAALRLMPLSLCDFYINLILIIDIGWIADRKGSRSYKMMI
ncbi:hypothetical protein SPLC1_S203450 [Arthrospira platensis C1]|nr:hypothetical protein SPLC1_S203450 [Arthrospira platensis C1]